MIVLCDAFDDLGHLHTVTRVKQSIFAEARTPSGHESTFIRPGTIDYDFEDYTAQRQINGSISDWHTHHKASIFDHI